MIDVGLLARARGVLIVQQQVETGFELMQIAATLAAGMLASKKPESWAPDHDRNAAYAVEVYNACVRALRAKSYDRKLWTGPEVKGGVSW